MQASHGTSKKRARGDCRSFRLKTFCDPGHPVHFRSSRFQENMPSLLEFGHREEGLHGRGTLCWCFQLEVHRNPPSYVSLFIVEEMVEKSHPLRCQHCCSIGWGHHMICNRRFHFLLPSRKAIVRSDGPNLEAGGKNLLVAVRESRLTDLQDLLMHGVVHSNGFGHLLCVNGIEAGSEILSGRQILDLWDRICVGLGLRKVTLIDTARKGAMDLRLIHGVAYGEPWFGRWGYKFGRGSYGVTLEMYHRSIEVLRGLPLCLLLPHYGSSRHELLSIIGKYQDMAGHSLVTLGHLFQFMLELKARLPPEAVPPMDYCRMTMEPACRWSTKRLEMAAQVIVDALKRANFRWVSRQDVRDAARAYVGDTGLLDFVLKSVGNHVVGNYVVRRMVNPVTKILEYCLEDVSGGLPTHRGHRPGEDPRNLGMVRLQTTRVQLKKDLFCLYKYVLMDHNPALATGVFAAVPTAVRRILDTKQLVKDYPGELALENEVRGDCVSITLLCTVLPRVGAGGEGPRRQVLPPYELLTLPGHATISDLKTAVETAFKDVYLDLKFFHAESVVDVGAGDSELVVGNVEPGSRVVVSGTVAGVEDTYEGEDRDVNCACGVKEEDGERMVACDICGVWQHTRCAGIADGEGVPTFFLCRHCEHDIALLPSFLP